MHTERLDLVFSPDPHWERQKTRYSVIPLNCQNTAQGTWCRCRERPGLIEKNGREPPRIVVSGLRYFPPLSNVYGLPGRGQFHLDNLRKWNPSDFESSPPAPTHFWGPKSLTVVTPADPTPVPRWTARSMDSRASKQVKMTLNQNFPKTEVMLGDEPRKFGPGIFE
jgi:hypothetical protein